MDERRALTAQAKSLRLACLRNPGADRIDVRRAAAGIAATKAAMLGPAANTARRLRSVHLRRAAPWREAAAHHRAIADAMLWRRTGTRPTARGGETR